MKKSKILLIALAIMSAGYVSQKPSPVKADTVNCPSGYVCVPITALNTITCPSGYTCTPTGSGSTSGQPIAPSNYNRPYPPPNAIQNGSPAIIGTVTSITGASFTMISGGYGQAASTTYSVDASNATVYSNGATTSISSVIVGNRIYVLGTVSGTNITARVIRTGVPAGEMQRPGNWPGNMGGGQQYQDHPPFQGQMSSTTMGQWRMPGQDDGRMMRPATGTNPNNIGAPNSYNGAPMHVNIDSLIKQAVEEYMKNHPR